MIYFAYCGYSQAAGPRAASREAAGRISKEETRNTLAQFCSFPVLLQHDLQPRRGGTGVVAWPGLARSVPLSRLSRDHYWQKTRTVQVRRATMPNLPWSRYLKFASPGHRVARAGLCESERMKGQRILTSGIHAYYFDVLNLNVFYMRFEGFGSHKISQPSSTLSIITNMHMMVVNRWLYLI
jgi:hypothetical protein